MKNIEQLFPPGQISVALGTVGWGSDPTYFDQGSAENGGATFVKVTLVWGRSPTTAINAQGQAQGSQILASIMGPIWTIPVLGDMCILGVPDKMWRKPGACVILRHGRISPAAAFGQTTQQWPIANG